MAIYIYYVAMHCQQARLLWHLGDAISAAWWLGPSEEAAAAAAARLRAQTKDLTLLPTWSLAPKEWGRQDAHHFHSLDIIETLFLYVQTLCYCVGGLE